MEQQKQTATPDTKTIPGVQPALPQQPKSNLPQDQVKKAEAVNHDQGSLNKDKQGKEDSKLPLAPEKNSPAVAAQPAL